MSTREPSGWRRAAAAVLGVAVVSTLLSASAADTATDASIAFVGAVTHDADLSDNDFIVLVHPDTDTQRTLTVGDRVPMLRLPATTVRTSGARYALAIAPATLPERYVDDDGLVTVELQVVDPATRSAGHTMGAVRLMSVAGSARKVWADPHSDAAQQAVEQRGAVLRAGDEAEPTRLDPVRMPPRTDTALTLARGGSGGCMGAPPGPSRAFETWNARVIGTSTHWVTIGTSYPVGGNTARLSLGSAFATLGGAVSHTGSYGTWEPSGSRTTWIGGVSWDFATAQRGYRLNVEYIRYQYTQPCTYPSRWQRWLPRLYTGGAAHYTSPRPNWTKCQRLEGHATYWTRGGAGGNDYTLKNGVKIKHLIGIDLGVRRAYAGVKLTYKVSGGPKKVCGNNAGPGIAGKVMMKYA